MSRLRARPGRRAAAVVTATLIAGALAGPAAVAPASAIVSRGEPMATVAGLPLGPVGLAEQRTSTELAPGVSWTRVVRGTPVALPWVVEVAIPASSGSPDPDAPPRSVQDRASALQVVERLDAAGLPARAEAVRRPRTDVPAGVLGYRVRLRTTYATQAEAAAAAARLADAGLSGRAWFSGWDGTSTARGRWTVNVLTVDPLTFRGRLGATFGPDLERRETTSALASAAGAKAAVNGGFFVLDPAAGAPGDPAGFSLYDGVTASEQVGTRPALVLDEHARHTRITRPEWTGSVHWPGASLRLDGIDRVPGLIRSCGGDVTDRPTARPLHDVTCTDAEEAVLLDTRFGPRTPAGPGAEAVLDRDGRVLRVAATRGTALADGERSVQATGSYARRLLGLRPGTRVQVTERVGVGAAVTPGTTVINGGPLLVRRGSVDITQARDGMHQPANPSFDYGWALQRNPRTQAGVDRQGRTVLVTIDGRRPDEMGASLVETARVAQALGLVDAINLDGGGSTTAVVGGAVVNHPSDATGERPVGDAIVIR